MMKSTKLLVALLLLLGCGVDKKEHEAVVSQKKALEKDIDSLTTLTQKQRLLIAEMRDSIDLLLYPADQRLEQAKREIAEGEYGQALEELMDLKKIFPNAQEAQAAELLIESINAKMEEKRKEEERIRALGFKALPQHLTVEIGYNKIAISNISIGNTFVFDSYGDRYFYRDADRGNKYVTMAMAVTSTSHDPDLPQLALYTIQGDQMNYEGSFKTEFARWEDYGTYLGNYHDSHNDFAKVSTVKFKLGLQVSEDILRRPYAIVVKKENGLTSSYDRYENPPKSYIGSVSYPSTLHIDDFSDEYVVVKLSNL